MVKTYSFEPFNDFAALGRMLIKFDGQLPPLNEEGPVWFIARIGDGPTDRTSERGHTIEVADGHVGDLAAMASELHRILIELADNHRPYPPHNRIWSPIGAHPAAKSIILRELLARSGQ